MTAGFLLVGWNTYSAIVLAKDTYNGKMEWSKPLGYSIAGLAGLTAGLLFFYGLKATEHPELLDAEGDGEIYYEGGRMVSIEENTTVNYSWRTSPDDIEVDEWDIGSKVEERVQEEMYDGDNNRGYWTYRDYGDNEITVEYEWDKIVDEGEEEHIKSWAETDESLGAEGREETQRMTRAEAEALADKVVKLVTPYVDRVEVCGSYRRGSPRPGDLDVVIIPKKGVTLPEIVKAIKPAEVHWMGEKKAQVLIDDHNVDFRTSSPKGWGAALLYFTGPAGYNIGMRVRAKKMGLKLNEYGIFDRNTNAYLGGATEDEIYKVLGKTLKMPAMRAEGVIDTCAQCGAKGKLMTITTRRGMEKTFCGPICMYKWEGQHTLYAEEVFEAPRAAFTNADQAKWEKSYNIRSKKPLTKFIKQRMGGKKPPDDSRGYSYYSRNTPDAQGVTKEEAKLIQGYASVMKMCESRFNATNNFQDTAAYKQVGSGTTAYSVSWDPLYNQNSGRYLEEAIKDIHALEALDEKGKVAYMIQHSGSSGEEFTRRMSFMREFLRYYDITMLGPYKGIQMVATDRAPYETGGGYGNVHYSSRNPYKFGQEKAVVDIFAYNSTKETMTIGSRGSESAYLTRMTKMRPYMLRPHISKSNDASVIYETDGGYSYRSSGSQSFSLTPFILKEPGSYARRNPEPGYSSRRDMKGWRWDVEGWESRSSAPYRYATMVAIPNGEGLQMTYGGKILKRLAIVDTINSSAKLLKVAMAKGAAVRAMIEKKEEDEAQLRGRNQALTQLEDARPQIVNLLESLVKKARNAGVSEDDIYESLEMTQYDLEELLGDWESSDYMAEGKRFVTRVPRGCGVCATGPHPTMLIEDEVWVACPKCGLTKGVTSPEGWADIEWSEKDPPPKDPIIDVAWEDSNSED